MILFSSLAHILPGPANILCAYQARNSRVIDLLGFIVGVAVSSTILASALIFGHFDEQRYSQSLRIPKVAGGCYMLVVAYCIFSNKLVFEKGFFCRLKKGFIYQWVNPMVWIYMIMGLAKFYSSKDHGIALYLSIELLFVSLGAFVYSFLGHFISKRFSSKNHERIVASLLGGALFLVSIYIIIT